MNQLYPIIRRARRPLLPPDDPAPAVPPAAVELPPVVPVVVEPEHQGSRKKEVKGAAKTSAT